MSEYHRPRSRQNHRHQMEKSGRGMEVAMYLAKSNNGQPNFSHPTTGIFFMSQREAMVMMKKEISCKRYDSKNWRN